MSLIAAVQAVIAAAETDPTRYGRCVIDHHALMGLGLALEEVHQSLHDDGYVPEQDYVYLCNAVAPMVEVVDEMIDWYDHGDGWDVEELEAMFQRLREARLQPR